MSIANPRGADLLALYDALYEERDEQAWAVTFQVGIDKHTVIAFSQEPDDTEQEVAERIRGLLSDGAKLLRVTEWDG